LIFDQKPFAKTGKDSQMKNAIAWVAAAILVLSTAARTNAQTTNIDFFTLNLNIGLTAVTNNAPITNDDNTVTADSGQLKITSASIIQLLSGRRSFPLGKIIDGSSNAIPHLGAAVMTNFSKSAKLLVLQGLGTNHGSIFVVIRDGKHRVDYDVSEYFSFSPRGFSPFEGDHVDTSAKLDLTTGEQTTTRAYVNDFSFDDTPGTPDASDRVAFTVDGLTTEQRISISSRGGDLIDSDTTRSLNANSVAGTGVISNNFAVLKGFINAAGARHETK
jgi:hypothetical protein